MKLSHRRQLLRLAAGAAALSAASRIARAQTYPTRPVRIIVGFAAGNALDITARIVAQSLSERFGQPFIVENRPGAAGSIGTDVVAKSSPDGQTLLLVTSANATNATLFENLNFNFIRDIAPISSIARAQLVVLIKPSMPAKTLSEFIAYAKVNPGKISMGSNGTGSTGHVAGVLFMQTTNVSMVHVPYRGGSGLLTDLIGGQLDVVFDAMSSSIEHVRAGRLRALAVTGLTRAEVLPDIPTVSEYVSGYEVSVWNGLGAPKGTPAEIVEKLNREIKIVLTEPTVKMRFADLGYSMFPSSSADFGKHVADETEKWSKVIRAANIKPE
jgi:tripartite-type tricarboxylate transporter receptor subunit TctC